MSVTQTSITCAACGGPIVQAVGKYKDFCSEGCNRAGRAFCKACRKPLSQPKNIRYHKNYCDRFCYKRYLNIGEIAPSWLAERNRTECIVCGNPITQPHNTVKKFCSSTCSNRYYRTGYGYISLTEEWGSYAPETRKFLREVQRAMGIGAAHRLATAIDREYSMRSKALNKIGKKGTVKLTWEQVDEIRNLYKTEPITQQALAKKYDVSVFTIYEVVNYKRWKPEDDPRQAVKS